MTAIYHGCSLNVAIADSPSCDSGVVRTLEKTSICLGTVAATTAANCDARGKPPAPTTETANLLLVCEPPPFRRFAPRVPSILSSRGWVFQETLVSAVTLWVTHRGLQWDCCCSWLYWPPVGRWEVLHRPLVDKAVSPLFLKTSVPSKDPHSTAPPEEENGKSKWQDLDQKPYVSPSTGQLRHSYSWVTEFSRRMLTISRDKLPALAGLMSQLAAATGGNIRSWTLGRGSRVGSCMACPQGQQPPDPKT